MSIPTLAPIPSLYQPKRKIIKRSRFDVKNI